MRYFVDLFAWLFQPRGKRESGWVIERRTLRRRKEDRDKEPIGDAMNNTRTAKLIDAILEAWTRCLKPPYGDGKYTAEDGQPDCNRFVNEVCKKMGYDAFDGLLANQIHDRMKGDTQWMPIMGSTAQYYANIGGLVIAAWKNPDPSRSGHVAIVRPGLAGTSGQWNITKPEVPKVANVGPIKTCRLDRGANYAFGRNEMPTYFFWPPSLKGAL